MGVGDKTSHLFVGDLHVLCCGMFDGGAHYVPPRLEACGGLLGGAVVEARIAQQNCVEFSENAAAVRFGPSDGVGVRE